MKPRYQDIGLPPERAEAYVAAYPGEVKNTAHSMDRIAALGVAGGVLSGVIANRLGVNAEMVIDPSGYEGMKNAQTVAEIGVIALASVGIGAELYAQGIRKQLRDFRRNQE